MLHTNHTQQSNVEQPQRDQCQTVGNACAQGRQDKGAEYRARIASIQPASPKTDMRAHELQTNTPRSQNRPKPKRQRVQLTVWVKPVVKAALQRIAEEENLSVPATGAAFLEKAIQQDIHTQHGALLETIISQAIGRGMRVYSNRLAMLLVRVAFASEQTRALVTNILTRQPGVTPELLNTILDGSAKTAKRNITRRTPQLEAIIKELEAMLTEQKEKRE
jgi:hypothetical protein